MERSSLPGVCRWLLAAAALGALASCAAQSAESSASLALETEPSAPAPHIRIKWRKSVDDPPVVDYRARQYASPAVQRTANQRGVLIGTDAGALYRFRAGDGKIRWEKNLDGGIQASPVAEGDRVYVGTDHGVLYALDRSSGSVDWKLQNEREIEASPAVGDGLVFYTTNAGKLVAVDTSRGETAWTYSRSIPKEFTIKGSGTPVVAGQTVFCGFADGTVVSFDARSGSRNWVADISGRETEFNDVDDPVVVREDRVYATSYGSGVTALERSSGTAIWSRKFENVAATEYARGKLYLAIASGRVVALDARDGTGLWGFSMDGNFPVHVVATGAYLFASSSNGPLYILDRETGYPLRKWQPSNGINTAVAFSDRSGFMLSNKGYVYRFRIAY